MNFTDRQLEILTDYDLSTDCNDLTDSQISDIMAIEDLLVYLETKYKKHVDFISFTQGSPLNDETLVADIESQRVTVSRKYVDGKFVYKDDYEIILSKQLYDAQIKNFFDDIDIKVSVFSEISDMKTNGESLLAKVISSNFIFVGETMTYEEFKTVVKKYADWYVERLNGTANSTRFYLVREVDLQEIGYETYSMCIEDISQDNNIMCVISASGEITLK